MSASLPLIVVVDDSLVVRAMLARQLDDHGYQVLEATDGESALAICSAQPPDAVLLDLNLPGISGYEVLAALRADAATADIPVIILTERQSAEDAARAGSSWARTTTSANRSIRSSSSLAWTPPSD